LVESARLKLRLKHGGGRKRLPAEDIDMPAGPPGWKATDDLLALDEALTQLAALDARKAELVKVRYFAGLSVVEAANHPGIARATADRWWAFARAWLFEKVAGIAKIENE